jgi:hypothetical protein
MTLIRTGALRAPHHRGGPGAGSHLVALDIGEPLRTVELPDEEPLLLPETQPSRREEEREAEPAPVRR